MSTHITSLELHDGSVYILFERLMISARNLCNKIAAAKVYVLLQGIK